MSYWEAFLYGITQGITEYLPISSSAHLILLPKFMETQDPGLAFDVFLHVGTLLSTLVYFWRDWYKVAHDAVRYRLRCTDGISFLPIAVATVPALFAGALLHDWAETIFRGNVIQAATLTVGGLILWWADLRMPQRRNAESVTLRDAFWIGLAQCVALVPGVSRSGATITGGRLLGLDRASAARFSFLMSAPVVLAAVVYEMRNWDELLASDVVGLGPMVVACLASFVSGMVAIGGLLRLLRRFGYLSFAVYRIVLAIVILTVLGV